MKRRKQTVKLDNGEKARIDREALTVEYKGKTLSLEVWADMMAQIEEGKSFVIQSGENGITIIEHTNVA
jgi:phage-related protein